jgi:hypothetical protein
VKSHREALAYNKHWNLKIDVQAELEALLQSSDPLFILHLHEPHILLSMELSKRKVSFVRIAGSPEKHIAKLRRCGVDTRYVHCVKDNVLSLLEVRKLLKRHRVVCCAIDYKNEQGERAYVNPAIIEFANRYRISVVFVTAAWLGSNQVKLLSAGPYKDMDPVACAKLFVDFFNNVAQKKRHLRVLRYSEHSDWADRTKRVQKRERSGLASNLKLV